MTPMDETDLLASFNRHLAGIEADVKDGSASDMPRRAVVARPTALWPQSTGRRVFVPLLVAIALVVAIAVIRPIPVGPGPSVGPVGSQPAVGASPSSSAATGQSPARLRIEAYAQPAFQSEPPGIDAPGGVILVLFRVTVTSRTDAGAVTIPAGFAWRELDLAAGAYALDVSAVFGSVDVPCALQLDLAAGRTTELTVTDVLGDRCTFEQGLIVPLASPSPPPAQASGPPRPSRVPKSLISQTRAINDAQREAPAGSTYESISAGFFYDVQRPPRWLALDQLVAPNHYVWVVRFADPSTCPGRNLCGETVLYLDYVTGDFLVSIHVPAAP
jgi:hypothetical protein